MPKHGRRGKPTQHVCRVTDAWPIGQTREARLLKHGEEPLEGETFEPMPDCHHAKWRIGWAVKVVEEKDV